MPATKDATWLQAKLIGILGRMITVEEMRGALGLATSTYYDQLNDGRLITEENLTTAARNFGINEVYLLVECGLLHRATVEEYIRYDGKPPVISKKSRKRGRAKKPLSGAPDL